MEPGSLTTWQQDYYGANLPPQRSSLRGRSRRGWFERLADGPD